MKRLQDLRPADFDRVVVWRYEGESDDTAIVRATERSALDRDERDRFIAKTQFALAGGSQFVGFCSPSEDTELADLQPVIVTPEGPVFFYFEEPPSQETLDRQWRRLGVQPTQVFPVHFRCTVAIDGHFVTGVIDADDLTGAA